jgi:uncharacterized protein YbaP (TraB family)
MLRHYYGSTSLLLISGFLLFAPSAQGQKKYQSLMWEISGNGLEKNSYIYGTMHISGKMVFHLGEPFFEAMKGVDVLALELEPEAWLQAIFDDHQNEMWQGQEMRGADYGYNWNNSDLPSLEEYFKINLDVQEKVKMGLMYNPELLNYLLYRFGSFGYGADYEEDTWLDMYLYQTGKKMGKRTLGLETYAQSDSFYKKAVREARDSKEQKFYDEEDREEMEKVGELMETAYRTQDLDLIDSLNKKTTSPSFDKYILVERNKVFVHCMDSVMRAGQSLFAGMGCAHLPGDQGVIEALRKLGYVVKPFNKGERNVKSRKKIDAAVYKRAYHTFQSEDSEIQGTAPHQMYSLFQSDEASAMISLDIPNAASFMIYRIKSYAGLRNQSDQQLMASVDSMLYELVAGDILSQKRMVRNGHNGIELFNKNRRGDIHRKQIYILPEEIVIIQLISSGDKVSKGYGDEFFNSIQFARSKSPVAENWVSQDGTITARIPASIRYYKRDFKRFESPDFSCSGMATNGDYYFVQRHTVEDPEFFDEDSYECNRLLNAFIKDNAFKEIKRSNRTYAGRTGVEVEVEMNGKHGYAYACLNGLSYCIFTVFSNDSVNAKSFFDSIQFQSDRHEQYFAYNDTTFHYRVELPFEFKPYEDLESYYFGGGEDEDVNRFEAADGTGSFAVPGHAPIIQLQCKRSNAFADPDSAKVVTSWMENITRNDGFRLDRQKIATTPTGMEATYLYGDTACGRVNITKKILHYKTLYTITATYDSIAGSGEFINHFLQTFTPLDSTYKVRHFVNRDQLFLDSLRLGSVETRRQLGEILSDVDLEAPFIGQVREILGNLPEMNDEEDRVALKRFLLESLDKDTSMANKLYIKEQFYQHVDSSKTQIVLLRELLEMKTQSAFALYRELLLNEPPVTGDGNGTFDLLYDSLELAVPLFPDVFSLLTLDEYEMPTYRLVATMLDSGLTTNKLYENQLNFLILEAKNELKRLSSQKQLEYYSFHRILTYLRLLLPFKKQPAVAAIYEKASRIKNPDWLLEMVKFQLENEEVPADSLIKKIVMKGELVTELYGAMHVEKALQLWPHEWNNRDTLVNNYMRVRFANRYNKKAGVDTTYIFKKELRSIKNRDFEVFYIKFKLKEAESWLGMIVAFDHTDPTNLWSNIIESSENIVIDKDESDEEEFARGLRSLEESNRRYWRWKNSQNQYLY